MKIYQIKKILGYKLNELPENKEFDFRKITEKQIIDAIADSFSVNVQVLKNEVFVRTKPVLERIKADIEKLEDGKEYPVIFLFLELISDRYKTEKVQLKLNPFICSKIYGEVLCEKERRKQISKSWAKFMHKKFGDEYIEKRNKYLDIIKKEKVKEIKQEASKKIKSAEKEMNEYMLDI